jgi:hypothetical protein
VFVRFAYPAVFPGNINYNPAWITTRQPEIDGFLAGVGFAPRQQKLKDTITKSYEDALVNLLTNLSAAIASSQTSYAYQNTTAFRQQSTGTLKDFLILEIWIDPDTQGVRTLVIARK